MRNSRIAPGHFLERTVVEGESSGLSPWPRDAPNLKQLRKAILLECGAVIDTEIGINGSNQAGLDVAQALTKATEQRNVDRRAVEFHRGHGSHIATTDKGTRQVKVRQHNGG